MPAYPQLPGQSPAPVVHLHDRRSAWLGPTVAGLLALQACLLLVITLWVLAPRGAGSSTSPPAVATQETSTASDSTATAADLEAQRELLDRILAQLDPTQEDNGVRGLATELEKSRLENEQLRAAQRGYLALEIENLRMVESLAKAKALQEDRESEVTQLKERLTAATDRHDAKVAELEEKIETLEAKLEGEAPSPGPLGLGWKAWVALAAGLLVVLGGSAWYVSQAKAEAKSPDDDDAEI